MANAPGISKILRKSKADDNVMATNNSSIVSKRSVERLYYPEPHFYRHFVKKPQRRSPLINRGYWLRMRAIDIVVERFLGQSDSRHKFIVNLGCGYDPLPFQWLSKLPPSPNVTFVDVDFPNLIERKRDIISSTPSLCELLHIDAAHELKVGEHLDARHYVMLGCDLANTTALESMLHDLCHNATSALILCIAEVSVTYMDVHAANYLIQWASRHENYQMCILEQFLPDGPHHPFARKMVAHFENLRTPLQSLSTYPSLNDQIHRFESLGWPAVSAKSLWDVWCDISWIGQEERASLDRVEPFDEWEEFILFASHYFLLLAGHDDDPGQLRSGTGPTLSSLTADEGKAAPPHQLLQSKVLDPIGPRRFGSVFGDGRSVAYFGGIGEQTRTNSTTVFHFTSDLRESTDIPAESRLYMPDILSARSCQGSASSKNGKHLVAGGRSSPQRPLRECVYYNNGWQRVHDLPQPLFRHSMSWVYNLKEPHGELGVLLFGGKTLDNAIAAGWLLWQESLGWQKIRSRGVLMDPAFGTCLINMGTNHGLLIGGMNASGAIKSAAFAWQLNLEDGQYIIDISECHFENQGQVRLLTRFGAQSIRTDLGALIIGGVANTILNAETEVLALVPPDRSGGSWSTHSMASLPSSNVEPLRPLLIGHSVLQINSHVLIMGGGAVCFSFGTHWSRRPLLLTQRGCSLKDVNHRLVGVKTSGSSIHGSKSQKASDELLRHSGIYCDVDKGDGDGVRTVSIPALRLQSQEDFKSVIAHRLPVVIQDLNMGPCLEEWTLEGIKSKIRSDRDIVTHVSTERQMRFRNKNFVYSKKSFGTFIDEVINGSPQYLRSLASENPTNRPANIFDDFPEIAADFIIPGNLVHVLQHLHSSVLRISGPVEMWLHYDVMANVLCQIVGRKRLLLYPPSDVLHLDIPAGASSSSIPVFDHGASMKHPSLQHSHPHEVTLGPGDVLFIPPLWSHAASPEGTSSVAVNVFFRDLANGYAPGKDVYANRDVQAYETGRISLAKLVKSFEHLPHEMAGFYLARLSDELRIESKRFSTRS